MSSSTQQFEVFFDGDCPLCRREIDFLRRRDRQGQIAFTDIDQIDFSESTQTPDRETLMAEIHGRMPDGSIVKGVEVFRQLYSRIGWSWPVSLSRWPGISQTLDFCYRIFARNRLWLTGRHQCDDSCQVDTGR